jgi:hypothetical protein
VGFLTDRYLFDDDSPYQKIRYKTRENYRSLCRRVQADHGDIALKDINARLLIDWHKEWSASGKIAMAHALMGQVRRLLSFGVLFLEDAECQRIWNLTSKMRFKMAKRRAVSITEGQVNDIRAEAHKQGFPSVAMAQAIQYACGLQQKDVIGEWVPINEPGAPFSEIHDGKMKWVRGIRWSEIDENYVLRHTTSREQAPLVIDLRSKPMVMEEFGRFKGERSGALINYELNGRPYQSHRWRRTWRKIAKAAGVPNNVTNRDSSKSETPASRRAFLVSPSEGNRRSNDPSTKSLGPSRLKGTTSERP